jgi:hypothetical protein
VRTRRDLLRSGLSTAALCALPRCSSWRAPRGTGASGRPRYFCSILLTGGIDPVCTLDPKTRAEVEPWVDIPYTTQDILSWGDLALGPHLSPLSALSNGQQPTTPIALVRGVRVETGNHRTGEAQFIRLRTQISEQMPLFFDLIGAHRDTQPLASIVFGDSEFSSGWFGGEIFPRLDRTPSAQLEAMAAALRAQARTLKRPSATHEELSTAAHLESCAALFERLPSVPPFKVDPSWPPNSEDLQRTLWAFENDLTASLFLSEGNWDTHVRNTSGQAYYSRQYMPGLARFISELSVRRNRFGLLSDTLVLMAGSEIGRLPRLNEFEGKDHFPEAPYLFAGRAINTNGQRNAAYGQTGRSLAALPISLKSGQPRTNGHSLMLDDVGATLLRLFGIDPIPYGYDGQILEFLLA